MGCCVIAAALLLASCTDGSATAGTRNEDAGKPAQQKNAGGKGRYAQRLAQLDIAPSSHVEGALRYLVGR